VDPLNSKQLKQLQHALTVSKIKLEKQLLINKDSAGVVELDQTLVGRVSRMDAIQQQSMVVSTRQIAQRKLKKVQAALNSIANDDYGYCRQCDEPIGFLRLTAQPEANLCFLCQDKADQQS